MESGVKREYTRAELRYLRATPCHFSGSPKYVLNLADSSYGRILQFAAKRIPPSAPPQLAYLRYQHAAPLLRRGVRGLHHLEGDQPRLDVHRGRRACRHRLEEELELVAERLLPRGLVRLHHALGRAPDVTALDVAVHEHANLARAEVARERALLAHDDAVTIGARRELARLDERGHLAVLARAHAQVVHPASGEIAKGGRHRRGRVVEQVRERIEVVDAVRLGHSHVGSRALEAREAPRAVAHGADGAAPDPLAHELRHGMEAEDVADLEDAPGRADDVGERASLRHRQGQRLLHEAVLAR